MQLFGAETELIALGIPALRANFLIAPVLGFVMLATTFFQSIGKPGASSIITVIRQIVALVPFLYILPMCLDMMGIFYAQPLSDLLATVLAVVLLVREWKKMQTAEVIEVVPNHILTN